VRALGLTGAKQWPCLAQAKNNTLASGILVVHCYSIPCGFPLNIVLGPIDLYCTEDQEIPSQKNVLYRLISIISKIVTGVMAFVGMPLLVAAFVPVAAAAAAAALAVGPVFTVIFCPALQWP